MAGILLFGGSFDPLHHGHLIVSRAAAEQLDIPRVVLIPGGNPPHKSESKLAPAIDRLAMCRAAVARDPRFEVSDWEIEHSGPTYTLHTVEHFRAVYGDMTQLYWLIGRDSLHELHTWYRVADLARLCTFVTVGRPNGADSAPTTDAAMLDRLAALLPAAALADIRAHILTTPLVEISATDIRTRVATGDDIRYLVPPAVREYIAERGLYH